MLPTGLLPLNKPVGARSTSCVEAVRRCLGKKVKVGHGGTLDSTASGLLILLIGGATRLSGYIMSMPKCYEAVIQLGSETTTDDASGDVTRTGNWSGVTDGAIDSVLPSFMGCRMQEPPQISAVHVGGERAHKLAREGKVLSIEAKPVSITKIQRLSPISADGKVTLKIDCHKGTYIRSLSRDLGRRLGCGAYVSALHRVSVGPYAAADSPPLDELCTLNRADMEKKILPLDSLYGVSTRYSADDAGRKRMLNGCTHMLDQLARQNFGQFYSDCKRVVMTANGIFSICEYKRQGSSIELSPEINIFYNEADDR